MKKVAVILVIFLMILGVTAAPSLAKADKCPLQPCSVGWPDGLGSGFVIFNDSSGGPQNLEVTVSLKGATELAGTTLNVFLFVDWDWYGGGPVGTVTVNKAGNATFHVNALVKKNTWHKLGIDLAVGASDRYEFGVGHNEPPLNKFFK